MQNKTSEYPMFMVNVPDVDNNTFFQGAHLNNPITVGELFKRLNQLLTTDVQLPRKGTPDILMSLQGIAMPDNVLIQLGFFSNVLNYLIQTGLAGYENDPKMLVTDLLRVKL